MAVTDSHGDTLNEFSVREEENPQKLASPEPGATAKRKKKRKKINEESNEQSQVEVFPKPSVDSQFSQEGNVDTAADNPQPTPKKKKIKNVRGEPQLQTSDPSIAVCVESDDTRGEGARLDDANGNGGLFPESLLDTPVPIVSHEENAEGTALNPGATAKKKRKKKILQGEQQICDPSIQIGVERDDTKDEVSREGNVNENGGLCPQALSDTPVLIVSHEEKAEGTALDPSPTPNNKNKKVLQGAEQICDPSIRIGVKPDVAKDEGSREGNVNENGGLFPQPLLDTPVPILSHEENAEGTALNPSPTHKKKRKKKILQGEGQIYDPSIRIGLQPDVAKDEGSREGDVNENGSLCPKPLLDTLVPIVSHEENVEGTALNPSSTPKKKRNKKILLGAEQICDPSIQIGVEPDVGKDEGSREGDVNENGGLCHAPLLDTPVPIVSHEENAEGTALNHSSTPKKKKRRKKILQSGEQISDLSIQIGVERDVAKDEGSREGDVNENGGVCPKSFLDAPVPIVSHEENAEGTALNPSSTPKKKRNKKILQGAEQICDPSIRIGVEPDVGKDEGSQEGDVKENGGLCPAPLLDTPVPIVSLEENAEGTALNPSSTPKKKRRKKILQSEGQISDPSIQIGVEGDVAKDEGSREGDVNENGGVCPKPFLDAPVPIVYHEENAEGTALNPSPTPKKKRNKKILQGAEQICDPSIRIGVEPDVGKDEGSREGNVNKNEDLCPKPLLDKPIPIVSLEEKVEATAQNPSPPPKEKSLQGAEQICDPSIRIGVEPDVTNEEGSQRGDAIGNGGLCPKTLLDAPPPIVPREENAQAAQNPSPKPKKKKENLQGAEQICDPSIRIGMESDVPKEGGQQGSEKAETSTQNPIPTPKRKRRKNVQGEQQQQLQICNPSISIGVEPDVKKERAQQVNANEVGVSGISEERPGPDSTAPEDRHQKMDSVRKKKKALKSPGAEAEPELKESYKTENPQMCILDLKQKEAGANAENSGVCSKPEVAPQLYIADLELKEKAEVIEVNKEHPQAGSKPELESPVDMPTQTEPRKKKKKKVKKKKETKPTEVHAQHPQPQPCSNHAPTVQGIIEECPAPEGAKSSTGSKALKPPGAEAEPELKESYKTENPQQCTLDLKQKEAGANAENSGVFSKPEVAPQLYIADLELKEKAEVIEVNKEHPQAGSKPELESPVDMPTQMEPRKKKKKKVKKKKETKPTEVHAQHPQPQPCSNHAPTVQGIIEECPAPEGAKSNEADGKPPETPVQGFLYPVVAHPIDPTIPVQASPKDTATAKDQDLKMSGKKRKRNPIAAPSIEPTIQTGQDPPVDPGQMTKKKKKKKSKSAQKNKLLESEKHNAHPTAEAPVQKTEGPTTTKKSTGRCNAEQAANTLVHGTERLTVTKSPVKNHVQSSLSCGACQKTGHRLEQCKRLRSLSKFKEVCFFCGEIGHSLGKCGVSQAGGRFAKCLLCYEHGHFGYDCPQSDNKKKQKVLAANGHQHKS
ncbi:hypothetical protein PHAVU_007G070600 [Phaseolus vulgaris]|uniref:leashin-like n=1 Tax=Phaseolus vulgaris TaxID=3885 RepID=UPI0035CC1E38